MERDTTHQVVAHPNSRLLDLREEGNVTREVIEALRMGCNM